MSDIAEFESERRKRQAMRQSDEELLKPSGQERMFAAMEPEITTKDYIDRSMDTVRAQNDARFAEVLGEIKDIGQRLQHIENIQLTARQLWGAVLTGAATVLGVMLAALAFGSDRFDGGVGLADQRLEQMQRDADQDAIIRRLDALLAAQATPERPRPENPSE